MPGMKVRKIKPMICLKPGASKPKPASPISPNVASKIASDKLRDLLISQSLTGITWCIFFPRKLPQIKSLC